VFAQYTRFDKNAGVACVRPNNAWGFGGRLGVFLNRAWELEADATVAQAERAIAGGDIDYRSIALRINRNFWGAPLGAPSSFLVGVGGVQTSYDDDRDWGISGLAGVRWAVQERFAVRLDGVADYMPDDKNLNFAARLGASLLLGRLAGDVVAPEPLPVPAPQPAAPPPPMRPPPVSPAPPAAIVVDTSAITAPIYFDFDKSDIRPDAAVTLDRKIPWLQANPGMRIRIEGNADNRGSDEYNLALGQRRVAAARHYLADRRIDAGRFDLVSYGEERPVCSETPMTEACNQLNRRDDFRIVTVGGDGRIRTP